MGGYALPALDIKTPQQPDILDKYSQLLQIKNAQAQAAQQQQEAPLRVQALQQQTQTGQIQLQQEQQAQQDQQAFRTLAQDPSSKGKTVSDLADNLLQKGKISQAGWASAKKADIEQRQSLATLDKDQLANAKEAHTATQQLYDSVMDMPDDQLAANWSTIAQQYDAIPGNNKQPLNPQQPLTKQQLQQFGPVISMQRTYLDEADERLKKKADLQKTQAETAATAGKVDPASPLYAPTSAAVAMGTAPGAAQIQASEAAQAGAKAAAEAKARQPYELALAAQRQALSQGDPSAAAQLLVNGDATLSELKARGATPDFIAKTLFSANRLSGGKYNAQAADSQFQVAKSPTNVAFFGSANSLTDKGGTLDQLSTAAKDLPGGQIPVFNSIADAEKAATGSGPVAKYASVLLGVADDYSKVMGGGQGSDTSRAQALKLIPTNASPEARAAAIDGIRGAVASQANARIGNNPVLGRMYGTSDTGTTPKVAASSGGKVTVTAPDGTAHQFATQAQADKFKKLAGIQ